MPVSGDRLYDSPLPATPEPLPNLRLRREGDIRSGFAIDGDVEVSFPENGLEGA